MEADDAFSHDLGHFGAFPADGKVELGPCQSSGVELIAEKGGGAGVRLGKPHAT